MNAADTTSLAFAVFVQGMALSFGLIVAIGAQNAFVLRQGLRREHVGSVVLFCAAADAVLIAAGVMGMAQALGKSPNLARALALAGAAFLAVYGWRALQRARQSHRLAASDAGSALTLGAALAQAAAFTLLNPHVYLDTMLLVGSIGAQQPGDLRAWFIAGASGASLTWFALLGIGARWLAPLVRSAKGLAGTRRPDRRDHVRAVGDAAAARPRRHLTGAPWTSTRYTD
jgi:L-lysine exporter family protein LysE/ArgO